MVQMRVRPSVLHPALPRYRCGSNLLQAALGIVSKPFAGLTAAEHAGEGIDPLVWTTELGPHTDAVSQGVLEGDAAMARDDTAAGAPTWCAA
jgi:hypothetical protein